jgi:hypothetical protein
VPEVLDRKALLLEKKTELQQKQARLQAKINRLDEAEKKLANGRKILWGAALRDEAEKDPAFAAWALKKADDYFIRQVDKDRIAPDLVWLRARSLAVPTKLNEANSNRVVEVSK